MMAMKGGQRAKGGLKIQLGNYIFMNSSNEITCCIIGGKKKKLFSSVIWGVYIFRSFYRLLFLVLNSSRNEDNLTYNL